MVFAQQSADFTYLTDWFNTNSGAKSQLDSINSDLVTPFNSANNGDLSYLGRAGETVKSLADYFTTQEANPALDTCSEDCVLANVPSPGSASSVLFTNPTTNQIATGYETVQGYGYNASSHQYGSAVTIPDISTWNTSNYFYPLCTYAPSYFLNKAEAGFAYAGLYQSTGNATYAETACSDLAGSVHQMASIAFNALAAAVILAAAGAEAAAVAAFALAAAAAVLAMFAMLLQTAFCG